MSFTGCDHDCFRCPYPDCIAPDEDVTAEEFAAAEARDARIAEEISAEKRLYRETRILYYERNKEAILSRCAENYRAEPEKYLERVRQYTATERGKALRRIAEAKRRAKNPEAHREKQRAYRMRKKEAERRRDE